MVSIMSSTSSWTAGSPMRPGCRACATLRRAGWPSLTMGRTGMVFRPRSRIISPRNGGERRLLRGLALAGAALTAPAVAHALIQRRLRAPETPGWGRTHRYAGHLGSVVFQELGAGPAVVLLHAFGPGFDACQWRAAAEA